MVGTFIKAGGNAVGLKLSTVTELPDCESDTNKGSPAGAVKAANPIITPTQLFDRPQPVDVHRPQPVD